MNRTGSHTRLAVLALGALEALVIWLHVLGVQETPNWRWPWRNGRVWPLYPAMLLAALPLAAGVWIRSRWPHRRAAGAAAMAGVMLSVIAFQLAGQVALSTPPDWLRPSAIIEDRVCSSYWTDARTLIHSGQSLRQILSHYPQWMRVFHQHSREKPPGPVMFYFALQRLLGTGGHAASFTGALLIACGAAAGVWTTQRLAAVMLQDDQAASYAALLYALTPALIAMFPVFDACYPAAVTALALLCIRGMRTGDRRWGITLGLAITAVSLFVYNLLVMGTFLLALLVIESGCANQPRGRRAVSLLAWAAATAALAYTAIWLLAGFDPVSAFLTAVDIEKGVNVLAHRRYPQTIAYDLFDFLFGTGRMMALLALLGVANVASWTGRRCQSVWFIRACLLQILLVACTGLLRGETARVWCFLVPLLAIPAGLALRHWPPRWRYAALLVQGVLMLMMVQNVEFNTLSPPPF